jgi:hypothetical protein
MPLDSRERRALWWYRVVYSACIIVMSVETAARARNMVDHRFWLGGLEIIGALMLLIRRVQVVGLVILFAVYAVAAVHASVSGEIPAGLVLFAASAWIIVFIDR